MSWNLIDFPPWRKSRGPFQDLALLAQHLVLAPPPLQLSRHVPLAVVRRVLHLPLAAAVDPVPKRGQPDPEIRGDLAPGTAAGLG
jgi:hypothetical protein